jgi:predicted nucleic acid-binding Zn finger protein
MTDRQVLLETVRSVIQQIGDEYKVNPNVPRHLLIDLYSILGDQVYSALDIVDRRGVIRIGQFGGGREHYQVKGNRGVKYSLIKSTSFCNCPAFQYKVLEGKELMCKHLLALAIAEACSTTKQYTITKQEMREYLRQI